MVEKQDQEKYAATPSLGKLLLLHWKWSLSFVVGILVFFVLPVFRVVGLWWGLVVIVISFVVCSFVLMKLVAMDNAARSEAEPNDSMSDAQNSDTKDHA
ncbi:MAG: hypothetical protein EKK49_12010 [Rhodocyclaceae bacterium]|jgi:uncharacterized membrane protein YagU involved in acid resistance|nr:MAG: hypothetical protein EKK49_12010 [Rhodocyclaceae bacterium]